MIVLDTNVVSALMRDPMDASVCTWIQGQPPLSIWVTAITVYECRFGIATLAPGRRRDRLQEAFTQLLAEDLGGRVLAFGEPDAEQTATLMAQRRARGRSGELRDSMIAGIVKARRARLATRNVRHFEDAEIDLVDPWRA